MKIKDVEMIETKINGRWKIILPKHRSDRAEWYTEEGWERKRLDSLYEKVIPGDEFIYVGAEEGEMPALLQMWGARVFLLEPNELVWPNIKAIWEANHMDNPEFCFPGFASDKNSGQEVGTYGFFPKCADGDLISNHGFKELADPGSIPQIMLDSILSINTKGISIDVEGSEWQVLKGAQEILKNSHPKLWISIHPEFMNHYYRQHSADMRRWIMNFGYKETLLDYAMHETHVLYE